MQSHPRQDKLLFAVFLEGCVSVVTDEEQRLSILRFVSVLLNTDVMMFNPPTLTVLLARGKSFTF